MPPSAPNRAFKTCDGDDSELERPAEHANGRGGDAEETEGRSIQANVGVELKGVRWS